MMPMFACGVRCGYDSHDADLWIQDPNDLTSWIEDPTVASYIEDPTDPDIAGIGVSEPVFSRLQSIEGLV